MNTSLPTDETLFRSWGIERLTPMQEAVCRAYADPRDLVLLSPTGSGKTLAYLLPLLRSLRAEVQGVQALILVPSRELALQTETVFRQAGTKFRIQSCYGGRPAMDEHRAMNALNPAVIVGTPGRLGDHLRKQNFDVRAIRTLVIDEFDKCLELGFREEMAAVVNALPAVQKRVLLSATDALEIPDFVGLKQPVAGSSTTPFSLHADTDAANAEVCISKVDSYDAKVDSYGAKVDSYDAKVAVSSSCDEPSFLRLDFLPADTEDTSGGRLCLRSVLSPEKDKLETLYRLLCTLGEGSTLVFVNYRESADRVAGYLLAKRFPCDTFHGGMEQQERERALYKFRNGSCPVLVSTDLAARGLDIPGIDNVVHYHLPVNEDAFVHRNGRTARWQASGSSYLLLHAEEKLPAYITQEVPPFVLPERTPQPPKSRWVTLYIGKGKKDKLNKVDIVGFLYKKGGLAREDVGQVDVKDHYAFAAVRRSKVKQLLTLLRGEKIKGVKTVIEEAR